jgi:hypothetical protein
VCHATVSCGCVRKEVVGSLAEVLLVWNRILAIGGLTREKLPGVLKVSCVDKSMSKTGENAHFGLFLLNCFFGSIDVCFY